MSGRISERIVNARNVPDDAIYIHKYNDTVRIPLGNVLAFKAEDKYVVITHVSGTQKEDLSSMTIAEIEEALGTRGMRIHRSVIIMVDKLVKLSKNEAKSHIDGTHLVAVVSKKDDDGEVVSKSFTVSRRYNSVIRKYTKGIRTC